MPSTGTVGRYLTPGGPGVRLDSCLYSGYKLPTCYDSMLGKLIVSGLDWKGTVRKASRALDEYFIEGIKTNIPLCREIVKDSDFKNGQFNTSYLDTKMDKFNLKASSSMSNEDEKLKNISNLIKKIKENRDNQIK